MKFTEKFTQGEIGESITIEDSGIVFVATIHDDTCGRVPWLEEEGHGPVSPWVPQGSRSGRILSTDKGSSLYYDYEAAIEIAKQEGWDAEPYGGTADEKAKRAVEADFEFLRAWCSSEWRYVGVVISATCEGVCFDNLESLWGIESCSLDVLNEVANELLEGALEVALDARRQLITRLIKSIPVVT